MSSSPSRDAHNKRQHLVNELFQGRYNVELHEVEVLNQNFRKSDEGFAVIIEALQRLTSRISAIEGGNPLDRLSALEGRMAAMENIMNDRFDKIEQRLSASEKSVETARQEMKDTQTSLIQRLMKVEGETSALKSTVADNETKTASRFAESWRTLADVQHRLDRLENQAQTSGLGGSSPSAGNTRVMIAMDELQLQLDALQRMVVEHDDRLRGVVQTQSRHSQGLDEQRNDLDDLSGKLKTLDVREDEHFNELKGSIGDLSEDYFDTKQNLTSKVERAFEVAAQAQATTQDLQRSVGDLNHRLDAFKSECDDKLNRLAASSAKSLRALERAIEALRLQIAALSDSSEPLIRRQSATACLSCDHTTAANANDRVAHLPSGRLLPAKPAKRPQTGSVSSRTRLESAQQQEQQHHHGTSRRTRLDESPHKYEMTTTPMKPSAMLVASPASAEQQDRSPPDSALAPF